MAFLVLATMVYFIWYTPPLFSLTAADEMLYSSMLYGLLAGPALTLVVYNPKKNRRELQRDMIVILILQSAAIIYSAYSIYETRPAYIVYNSGQFNVVTANSITSNKKTSIQFKNREKFGTPIIIGTKQPEDPILQNEILFSALHDGTDIYQMPEYYVDYKSVAMQAALASLAPRRFSEIHRVTPSFIENAAQKYTRVGYKTGLLPVVFRQDFAVAFIDQKNGDVLEIKVIPQSELK